jgi:hypothetical protein
VLKRQKERSFGFKLFIRTFIQVCAYYFQFSLGSNSLSFDVVNSLPFQTKLKKDLGLTERLFKRTSCVVRSVRKVLRDLYCDDLRALPDTTPLLPVFQLLIRFPQLKEPKYAKVQQCLALRLLLSKNLSQEDILGYIKEINQAHTGKDCLATLEGKVLRPDDVRAKLPKWLEESNTLQDRYVLMFYWLLRKRDARDFSYRNVNEGDEPLCEIQGSPLRGKKGYDVKLEEKVQPEKQHLVPYSLLEKLYNIEKRGRVSRGKVNNIGNLTFISQKLNSYETGLGSKPIDRSKGRDEKSLDEKRANEKNLDSHFLADGVGEAYDHAVRMVREATGRAAIPEEAVGKRERAQKAFEDFCGSRRNPIAEAFVNWVKELEPLSIAERLRPEERFPPTMQDHIRRLKYPDAIEDALLNLIGGNHLRFAPREVAHDVLARKVTPASDRHDRGFLMRFLKDCLEVEPADGSELYRKLARLMLDGGVPREKEGGKWKLPAGEEGAASTSRILTEFANLKG